MDVASRLDDAIVRYWFRLWWVAVGGRSLMVAGGWWMVYWVNGTILWFVTKHALALLAEERYDEPFRWVKLLHVSMFQSSIFNLQCFNV